MKKTLGVLNSFSIKNNRIKLAESPSIPLTLVPLTTFKLGSIKKQLLEKAQISFLKRLDKRNEIKSEPAIRRNVRFVFKNRIKQHTNN